MLQIHPLPPVWNDKSRILILGSFPSVRSRADGFYYAHPQNRFWPVLARIYGSDTIPQGTEARRDFALRHGIALWDVISSCEITGSSDASIRNAVPNDIRFLLENAPIRLICCNGVRAHQLYCRYQLKATGTEAILLPSTSPANAAWNLDRLTAAWKVIQSKEEP